MVMNLTNTQSTVKKHTHTAAEVQGLSEAITQAVANSNDVIGKGRLPDDIIYREEFTQKLEEKANAAHTHVMADITDLTSTLALKADLVDGKVPLSQLPTAFTQEVVERINKTEFPTQGAASTLYVETSTGKLFRWGGISYVELVRGMTSTDDLPEGQVNLYFTNAKKSALEQNIEQAKTEAVQTAQTAQTKANDAFQKAEAIEQTLANNKFVKWQGKAAPEIKDMTKDQYDALGTYSNDVLYIIVEE